MFVQTPPTISLQLHRARQTGGAAVGGDAGRAGLPAFANKQVGRIVSANVAYHGMPFVYQSKYPNESKQVCFAAVRTTDSKASVDAFTSIFVRIVLADPKLEGELTGDYLTYSPQSKQLSWEADPTTAFDVVRFADEPTRFALRLTGSNAHVRATEQKQLGLCTIRGQSNVAAEYPLYALWTWAPLPSMTNPYEKTVLPTPVPLVVPDGVPVVTVGAAASGDSTSSAAPAPSPPVVVISPPPSAPPSSPPSGGFEGDGGALPPSPAPSYPSVPLAPPIAPPTPPTNPGGGTDAIVTYVKQHPGPSVAIGIGIAVLLYLALRPRPRYFASPSS